MANGNDPLLNDPGPLPFTPGPPKDDEEFQARKSRVRAALSNPSVQQMLLITGLTMLANKDRSTSFGSGVGNALLTGVGAAAGAQQNRAEQELALREQQRKEEEDASEAAFREGRLEQGAEEIAARERTATQASKERTAIAEAAARQRAELAETAARSRLGAAAIGAEARTAAARITSETAAAERERKREVLQQQLQSELSKIRSKDMQDFYKSVYEQGAEAAVLGLPTDRTPDQLAWEATMLRFGFAWYKDYQGGRLGVEYDSLPREEQLRWREHYESIRRRLGGLAPGPEEGAGVAAEPVGTSREAQLRREADRLEANAAENLERARARAREGNARGSAAVVEQMENLRRLPGFESR